MLDIKRDQVRSPLNGGRISGLRFYHLNKGQVTDIQAIRMERGISALFRWWINRVYILQGIIYGTAEQIIALITAFLHGCHKIDHAVPVPHVHGPAAANRRRTGCNSENGACSKIHHQESNGCKQCYFRCQSIHNKKFKHTYQRMIFILYHTKLVKYSTCSFRNRLFLKILGV